MYANVNIGACTWYAHKTMRIGKENRKQDGCARRVNVQYTDYPSNLINQPLNLPTTKKGNSTYTATVPTVFKRIYTMLYTAAIPSKNGKMKSQAVVRRYIDTIKLRFAVNECELGLSL